MCGRMPLACLALVAASGCQTSMTETVVAQPMIQLPATEGVPQGTETIQMAPVPMAPVSNLQATSGYLALGPNLMPAELTPPQVSATERALELQQRLDLAQTELVQLRHKVGVLESDQQLSADVLARAEEQVSEAREDMLAMTSELEQWRENLLEINSRIQDSDQQLVQELDEIEFKTNRLIRQLQRSTSVRPQTQPESSDDPQPSQDNQPASAPAGRNQASQPAAAPPVSRRASEPQAQVSDPAPVRTVVDSRLTITKVVDKGWKPVVTTSSAPAKK